MLVNARLAARAGGFLLLLLLAGGCASGCGEQADPRPVRLDITAPADATVVHEDSVEVRGLVRPRGARVLVLGRPAAVAGGGFRARVPLREGPNLIDVGATARGAAPTWNALRVTREVLVRVPDLVGATRQDAGARLDALGLRAEVQEEGGLLDRLLGGDWIVCDLRPSAGSRLRRGERVRVIVAKGC
jgi:hypothetical protein